MSEIYIVCVDDEPEVLEAVERDLATLEEAFPLETASSAREAREILERIENQGDKVGVIFCDHVMPMETGVEFLRWMDNEASWKATKKALLTGQAGFEDTVSAINEGGLDFYLSKPWTLESLIGAAKQLMTDFVVESKVNPLRYMSILDTVKIAEAMRAGGLVSDS